MARVSMTDMGEVSLIFGMNVTTNYQEGTLTITQNDYVQSILERYGMLDCNFVHTSGYRLEPSEEQPENKLLGAFRESHSTRPSWDRSFILHRSRV